MKDIDLLITLNERFKEKFQQPSLRLKMVFSPLIFIQVISTEILSWNTQKKIVKCSIGNDYYEAGIVFTENEYQIVSFSPSSQLGKSIVDILLNVRF